MQNLIDGIGMTCLAGLLGLLLLSGCGSPTPGEVEEESKTCEHEWIKAASGDERCSKCGSYSTSSRNETDEVADDESSGNGNANLQEENQSGREDSDASNNVP